MGNNFYNYKYKPKVENNCFKMINFQYMNISRHIRTTLDQNLMVFIFHQICKEYTFRYWTHFFHILYLFQRKHKKFYLKRCHFHETINVDTMHLLLLETRNNHSIFLSNFITVYILLSIYSYKIYKILIFFFVISEK